MKGKRGMTQYELRCTRCPHSMPLALPKCPACGADMDVSRGRTSLPRWAVLFLLFFALGPLALGILWRRDNFSLREKWLLTAAVAAYTALAVWLVYAFVVMMSARVAEIMNGMPV